MTKFSNSKQIILNFALSFCILIFTLYIFAAIPTFAAEIRIDSKNHTIGIGEQFEATLFLNTNNEEINAVEGKITFSSDILELKEIRTANSIINFWIEKPRSNSDGQIIFSGITPGGYQGEKGLLFSLIFLPKKEGQSIIDLKEAKTLLNNGKGTEASLSISPYQFTISPAVSTVPAVSQVPSIIDREPPESFIPEIAQNPTIFNGKKFLVFDTQDKGSGIDHYEIKETRQKILGAFTKWVTAESPYVLQDQELRSYIFVKAVDKAGKERIVEINPQNPLKWYENYENWVIIVLGLIIAYTIKKFLWRRYLKK